MTALHLVQTTNICMCHISMMDLFLILQEKMVIDLEPNDLILNITAINMNVYFGT